MEARTSKSEEAASVPSPPPEAETDLYLALLEPGEPERVSERLLSLLSHHLAFDWAALVDCAGQGGRVSSAWERTADGALAAAGPLLGNSPLAAFDLPRALCEGSLPVDWGHPLSHHLHERSFSRILFVPLGDGSEDRTALLLAQRSPAPFRERGRALLETIAAPLGRALDAAGRERALERRVEDRTRELSVLYEISRAVGTTLRYEDLVRLVMSSLHTLLEYEAAAILLDLPGLRHLAVYLARPASAECRAEAASAARNAFKELTGRVAADSPLEVRHLDAFEPDAAMIQGRLASCQSAPLVRRGEVVGSLVVLSRREGALSESRLRLLQTIANQTSLTLDRLRTLQEAEESRVQSIIDSMPSGVLMTDLSFRIAFANPAARRTLENLTGNAAPAALDVLGGVSIARIARPVIQGRRPSVTAEISLSDPLRIYSLTISPVVGSAGAAGEPSGVVIVISDVTEGRMLQEQLLQSEKLSAIGEMISGVAHELNNPLASVMGFAQLLQGADVGHDVMRKLKIIHSESQRCQRVVQNLLSFARKHRPEKSFVDVNGILGSVLSLLSYQLRVDGVEVRMALDPGLPGVVGDRHLLQQVFLNLINNAHQAMKEQAGSRTLEISSVWVAPDDSAGGEGMLQVEIRDTGPGIPPENLKRIFDPFFTTKTPGQGTGLGLSLVQRTIREHGGQVYARSQLEKGTTFVVELPRGLPEEEQIDADTGDALPADADRPRSILVVDDEPALGELLVEALSSEGHRVHSVASGVEALRLIRQGGYDVVISDLKMPRMDGHQLFEQVREVNPELAKRMIFSTGDVASAQTQAFLSETGAPFIVKPFDIRDVQRTIARVLAPEES